MTVECFLTILFIIDIFNHLWTSAFMAVSSAAPWIPGRWASSARRTSCSSLHITERIQGTSFLWRVRRLPRSRLPIRRNHNAATFWRGRSSLFLSAPVQARFWPLHLRLGGRRLARERTLKRRQGGAPKSLLPYNQWPSNFRHTHTSDLEAWDL